MKAIQQLQKPVIGGSLASLALVLLLLSMTLIGLNNQQTLTGQIRTQVQIRERLSDLSQSVGQLDLLHLRYRATGMTLFRVGYDQITDSVNLQLRDLQTMVKHNPFRAGQLQLIVASIDTVQGYWRTLNDGPAANSAKQTALEEEKRLDVVRSAMADFDELSRVQVKKLQQRQDDVVMQLRSWLALMEILIAIILLIVSLRSVMTRIRRSGGADHGSLSR